jgi:WhiB family redox-sensing transcriptional regulator
MSLARYDNDFDAAPEPWQAWAACRGADTNLFFPQGETGEAEEQIAQAKAICARCPVRLACLDYAITTRQEYGVWGGATEAERRSIRRRRQAERRRVAAS